MESIIQFFDLDNFGATLSETFSVERFKAVSQQIANADLINILVITLIPAIIIGLLIYSDRKHKQPWYLLLMATLSGLLTVSLAYVFNAFAGDILGLARTADSTNKLALNFDAMYGVGLAEEAIKMAVLFFFIKKNKYSHAPYTGVVYGALIGLSFAIVENLLGGYINNLMRCFTSVPMHMCVGVIMGYYMSLSDLTKDDTKKRWFDYKALFIPPIIHGTYNGLAANIEPIRHLLPDGILQIFPSLTFFGIIIGIYIVAIKLIFKMYDLNEIYFTNGTYPEPYDLYTVDEVTKNKILDGHEYFENRQFINNQ